MPFHLVHAQEVEEIVFSGIPALKISEGGVNRVVENIKTNQVSGLKCIITKIGEKYFWTTRNNVEMIPVKSGIFLTLVAVSGAGYVRIILPEHKGASALMDETEKKYDYVEHMLIGLRSVTYFGKAR